jgi:hypothetical protein
MTNIAIGSARSANGLSAASYSDKVGAYETRSLLTYIAAPPLVLLWWRHITGVSTGCRWNLKK